MRSLSRNPARFEVHGGLSVTIVRVTQCDGSVAAIRISAQDNATFLVR
jgi:hypothetical protein